LPVPELPAVGTAGFPGPSGVAEFAGGVVLAVPELARVTGLPRFVEFDPVSTGTELPDETD
jgi:hypothetical protein